MSDEVTELQSASQRNNRTTEAPYYGWHLCQALWRKRPDDILKVYITQEQVKNFGPLLKWCAEKRLAYKIVEAENLKKVTKSNHHEGICVIARRRALTEESGFMNALAAGQVSGCVFAIDGVTNPHNVGAIMRVAAHFGISHILAPNKDRPGLSAAACRVSEGGSEHVSLVRVDDLQASLQKLRDRDYIIVGSSSHAKPNLYAHNFGAKSVLVLGGEDQGLSKDVAKFCDVLLNIKGSGAVESLNVASASALLAGEYWRQHS